MGSCCHAHSSSADARQAARFRLETVGDSALGPDRRRRRRHCIDHKFVDPDNSNVEIPNCCRYFAFNMDSSHHFVCCVVRLWSFGSLTSANHREWFLGCSHRPPHVVHASRSTPTRETPRRSWHRFRTHRRHRSRNGEREHPWLDRDSSVATR